MDEKRDHMIYIRVDSQELSAIHQRMEQLGIMNVSAFIRKMAIDGYIVKLDIPELRDLISLQRRSSNNINQIAKRVNTTGRVYAADLEQILQNQEQIWSGIQEIITRLAKIDTVGRLPAYWKPPFLFLSKLR